MKKLIFSAQNLPVISLSFLLALALLHLKLSEMISNGEFKPASRLQYQRLYLSAVLIYMDIGKWQKGAFGALFFDQNPAI